MERRGASPAARKECRAAARRARMERETLAAAPSHSPRPVGAPGPRDLRRRGAGGAGGAAGLDLTHTQRRAPRPRVFPLGRFAPPTFCSPPGKGGG